MLQFWKKRGQNETQKQPNPELSNNNQGLVDKLLNNSKPLLISAFVDENVFDIGEYELNKPRSRLYKTLKEILEDKSSTKSLQYFIQFMETQNVSSQLIYCWLDIQAFKDDVVQFNKTNHVNNIVPNNRVDQDNLSLTSSTTTTEDDTNSSCSSLAEKSAGNKQQQLIVDTALQIFKKYLSQEAQNTNFINLSETHRTEIIETMCDLKKLFQGHIFDNIQRDIETKMDLEYFPQFYASDFYCKYQIDVLTTSDLVVLDDLLYNETALFYFMDYLEQENCRHFLEFWIAATNFQQQLEQQNEFLNKNEAQDDAIVLYDKYFSLQAHCPLGFGDVVRCGVEQEICGENNGDLQMNCFYLPIKIVEYVLDKNFLKSFLGSQLYYKYLSELINSSSSSSTNCNNNNVMETESVGRKSTNSNNNQSDCGSERSYNTNSTFLALEINNIDQKTKKDEKINNNNHNKSAEVMMSIDTRLLCDPDALWKRKTRRNNANLGGNNRSVLSCGRVTSLGKFITDLEPCQQPSNSKLRSVMKKIVNFDDELDERKKEEMAWQVAEMIVKDITNITLSQQPNNN